MLMRTLYNQKTVGIWTWQMIFLFPLFQQESPCPSGALGSANPQSLERGEELGWWQGRWGRGWREVSPGDCVRVAMV